MKANVMTTTPKLNPAYMRSLLTTDF